MKLRIASAALVLGSLTCAQSALANDPTPITTPSSQTPYKLTTGTPASVGVNPYWLGVLDDHLQDLVTPGPGHSVKGAVALIARHGRVIYHEAFGLRDGNTGGSTSVPMTTDTIFDLESMTKPFTATVVMKLAEQGVLSLDDHISDYLPDFKCVYNASNTLVCGNWVPAAASKMNVKVRDLLRYSSGLDLDVPVADLLLGDATPWHTMLTQHLKYTPNTGVMYSDLGYRILGHFVEARTHKTLRQNVKDLILTPLGMVDTDYEPNVTMIGKMSRVAGTAQSADYPTPWNVDAYERNRYLRGEVQDEQDYWVQYHNTRFPSTSYPTGVGCDGLFSTAWDLALFGQMFLNRGKYIPQSTTLTLLSTSTVDQLTSVQTATNGIPFGDATGDSWSKHLLYTNKGFGWELPDIGIGNKFDVSGRHASTSTYWKTGGAGTFIIIDPVSDFVGVLLTNHGLPAADELKEDSTDNNRLLWKEFEEMLNEIRPDWFSDLMEQSVEPTPIIYPTKPPAPYVAPPTP